MSDVHDKKQIRTRSRKRDAFFALAALLIVLVLLEGVFRLLEHRNVKNSREDNLSFQHDVNDLISLLETDSNLHELQGGDSLYIDDPDLIWKLRPGFKGRGRDSFAVSIPEYAPEWSFSISRNGFRGEDFDLQREQGVFRVVSIGDSCTFGFGVDQGDSYPAQLEKELDRHCPGCSFEILNLGVPGYSSRQGLDVAKQWLGRLSPQVVIISYGVNDSGKRIRSDADEIAMLQKLGPRLRKSFGRSALFRAIEKLSAGKPDSGANGPQMVERVSVENYRRNISEIAQMAVEAGAKVILLDSNFFSPYSADTLKQIAAEHPEYTLVDIVGLLAAALQDPDKLRKRFPRSTNMAIYYHRKIIAERPMFLLMVDPVHPNAIGYHIISAELASLITGANDMDDSFNEKLQYIRSLPPLKRWALFKDFTILEKRAASFSEQPGEQ